MLEVFHFTLKEKAEQILIEGLIPQSQYNSLGSSYRKDVNYGWLKPEHDLMGYRDSDEYICLKLNVSPDMCKVANMDWSSAAFVNYVGAGKEKDLKLAEELVRQYEETAVSINDYELGMFRAPEVIISNKIEPVNINIYKKYDFQKRNKNIHKYNKKWKKRFKRDYELDEKDIFKIIKYIKRKNELKKIAIHDDSSGLLVTYYLKRYDQYYTLMLGDKRPDFLLKEQSMTEG